MAKVVFPCEHVNEVNFVGRSRFVACTTCGKWAGIERIEERKVTYIATQTNYRPKGPYDGSTETP